MFFNFSPSCIYVCHLGFLQVCVRQHSGIPTLFKSNRSNRTNIINSIIINHELGPMTPPHQYHQTYNDHTKYKCVCAGLDIKQFGPLAQGASRFEKSLAQGPVDFASHWPTNSRHRQHAHSLRQNRSHGKSCNSVHCLL